MEKTGRAGAEPNVAILDYGMGNLRSVLRAFEHLGARARLVTRPEEVEAADALVFPGQGAIMDTMRLLRESGWDERIRRWVGEDRPFFGICLGLQALFAYSEEGDTEALGILEGRVRRFSFGAEAGLRIPHMGWNAVAFAQRDGLTAGLPEADAQFYFVHSYYAEPADGEVIWGTTDYGGPFCSAVRRGRLVATQFHPEKSQALGLRLYANFLRELKEPPVRRGID